MTLTEIIQHLTGADRALKSQAADHAMRLGEDAAPAAAHLAAHSGDSDIGEACIEALENMGPPPVESLDALTQLLDRDELPAYWAATLIGRLGAAGAPATDRLARTAAGRAPLAVRERAVWALGKIGPAAAGARPTLEKLVDSPQPRLARLSKQAIASMT